MKRKRAKGNESSSFDRVYRGMLRDLRELRYESGQRLIEASLMRRFDVGRGTIREVLNRLSAGGLVTLIPHHGASVRRFSRREVGDLLDIVDALMQLAARRAAERVSIHGHPALLVAANETIQLLRNPKDVLALMSARDTFNRRLMEASGNSELQRLFPDIQILLFGLQFRRVEEHDHRIQFATFAKLTQAILSGDGDYAEAAARQHVLGAMRAVELVPVEDFSRDEMDAKRFD